MKIFVLIFFNVLLFSCSDDSTNPSEDSIVGMWEKEISIDNEAILILDFKKDGDYFVYRIDKDDLDDIDLAQTGEYTLTGSNILMKDGGCDEIEGEYRLEFNNNQVEFIIVDDECERAKFVEGIYDKSERDLTEFDS